MAAFIRPHASPLARAFERREWTRDVRGASGDGRRLGRTGASARQATRSSLVSSAALARSAPVRFLAALVAFAPAPASRPVRTHTRAHERNVGERGSRREAAGCAPAIVQLAQCHVCVRPSTCGSRARSPGPPSSIMCCCDFRVLRARRGGPRCLRRRASHGNTRLSRGCAHIQKLVVARSTHAHTQIQSGARGRPGAEDRRAAGSRSGPRTDGGWLMSPRRTQAALRTGAGCNWPCQTPRCQRRDP